MVTGQPLVMGPTPSGEPPNESYLPTKKRRMTLALVGTLCICIASQLWSTGMNTTKTLQGSKVGIIPSTGAAKGEPLLKTIVFFNEFSGGSWTYRFGLGREPFITFNCSVNTCRTSREEADFPTADAIVVHMGARTEPRHPDVLPRRGHPGQIFVFYAFESPLRTNKQLPAFNDVFNLTVTYLEDARTDIRVPLGRVNTWPPWIPPGRRPRIPTRRELVERTKMAVWIVSNCRTPSKREDYVRRLSRHVTVDVYGGCGTHPCPVDDNATCIKAIGQQYKFYLAFENSLCKDYLTEKPFKALQFNMVPIVLGKGGYAQQLPPNSYINVRNFKSPAALAKYLTYLHNNDSAYMEYFQWRQTPRSRIERIKVTRPEGFCKLCEILHNPEFQYKTNFDVYNYWVGDAKCASPTEIYRFH